MEIDSIFLCVQPTFIYLEGAYNIISINILLLLDFTTDDIDRYTHYVNKER